jgi:2-dehydropantoate 2-reductase
MMKIRIGILGMGGVGGYFGGLLAKAYYQSDAIEIIFIARGETKKQIEQKGLTIKTDDSFITVKPHLVSDDAKIIGRLDYLICATKTYQIQESLTMIATCIDRKTIILPLYNGVDGKNSIENIFPLNIVLDGCVYIVAMIQNPAEIIKIGTFEKLFFGSKTFDNNNIQALQNIFVNANIDSVLANDIEATVWEKFIYISALATATTYLNQNIGAIVDNEKYLTFYKALLNEICALAFAKKISVPINIAKQTLEKLMISPKNATSSMHRDFLAGNQTEFLSLTSYVVCEAKKHNIQTPNYQVALDYFNKRV